MAMNKQAVRRWRRTVWRELERTGLKPASDVHVFNAGMILAAISAVGTDLGVLSELVGLSEDYVRAVVKRARKQGVLVGQRLRTAWNSEAGGCAWVLDAMATAHDREIARFVDPKRSAAQKARAASTRARGPRKPRTKLPTGAMFTPQQVDSNPLYGLDKWKDKQS